MEKTRVPECEEYWYLSGVHNVERGWDNYGPAANLDFANNNYFHTKEEAESMARKLRAVLKGAVVIEKFDDINICDIEGETEFESGIMVGWQKCYNWFKSKIIK